MADDDGKPTDPPDPRYQPPAPVKPVAPAPRVNPPNINTARDTPPVEGQPGFGDFVEWMRVQMGGAATVETQRTLIPKERKKFQRRDAESKTDKAADAFEGPEDQAKPTSTESDQERADAVERGPAFRDQIGTGPATPYAPRILPGESVGGRSPRVRRAQKASAKRNPWVGLLIQVGALALLAGCFFLGRLSVTQKVPGPAVGPAAPEIVNKDGKTTTKLLSEENAALIDQAMAAEQSYDFLKARALLEKVRDSGEHVHGLAFQLAQLAIYAGDSGRAIQLLNDAINDGSELASTYALRATLGGNSRAYRSANTNDYETATRADPFDARIFYQWGMTLRASGKYQAALVHLHQAFERLREPAAEGLYRLAIRLALIDLGQEQEFAEELNKRMALPSPEIDWLFTAAALKVRDNKFTEAAALLTRAEQVGDPDAFALRLRDYLFVQHRVDKELKPFFDRLPPPRPGTAPGRPAPGGSPSPVESAPPTVGLEVPTLSPPASPGAEVPH